VTVTEPEYIRFDDAGPSTSGKTRLWDVVNKNHQTKLGRVMWYGGWRQYVFVPHDGTEYSAGCLRDIAAFVDLKTKEHRSGAA
jgi:hypothetical protein